MKMQSLRFIAALAVMAPAPAFAQAWRQYAYSDTGFAVQLPLAPTVAEARPVALLGLTVPQKTYVVRQDDIVFSMAVSDFNNTAMTRERALQGAVAAAGLAGKITLDTEARIDREWGRELSVAEPDGGQSIRAVFFVNHKLYELSGKSLPPDPKSASGKAARFQQSLEFIGLGYEAQRPENQPGYQPSDLSGGGESPPETGPGPAPGRVGGRRGPPPQAFADCKGLAEGAAVKHTLPGGETVDARCVTTPRGLAARPLRPPGGGRGGPPPEGG